MILRVEKTALLSQEGSGIAKRIPRGGWFPYRTVAAREPSLARPRLRLDRAADFSSSLRPAGLALAPLLTQEGSFALLQFISLELSILLQRGLQLRHDVRHVALITRNRINLRHTDSIGEVGIR